MDRLDAFRRHLKIYFLRTAFNVILPRFGGLTDGAKEPLDFLCHHCALVYVIIVIFLSSIMTCTVSFSNVCTGYF